MPSAQQYGSTFSTGTAVKSFDDIITRSAAGYHKLQKVYGHIAAVSTATLITNQFLAIQRAGYTKAIDDPLPSGVSGEIISSLGLLCSTPTAVLVARLTSLGSIDVSGGSGTFTDGSVMPTITEGGVSRQSSGPLLMECTTALNSDVGTLTITYKDQDGNSAEATSAMTLTNSATAKTCGFAVLNTGDIGVTDVTAAARGGGTTPTGVVKFWGVRPVCLMNAGLAAGHTSIKNFLFSAFPYPKLLAGEVIGVFALGITTANSLTGFINLVGDS